MAEGYVPVIFTPHPVDSKYVKFVDVDTLHGTDGINGKDGSNGTNGKDGANGSDGINGTNGTDGKDGSDADATDLYNKLKASSTAISSVELNPDHEGLSVGVGASLTGGVNAGAVGVMYGVKGDGYSVGYNVKAYQAEGGHNGVGFGVTVGF